MKTATRYLIVGVGCALLNNAILIGADALGAHYLTAVMLTFVITLPLAYMIHALWTFASRLSWMAFTRYVGGSISSLIVTGLLVAFLCGVLQLEMVFAAPLATVGMTIYNFVMTRWAVSDRKPEEVFAIDQDASA